MILINSFEWRWWLKIWYKRCRKSVVIYSCIVSFTACRGHAVCVIRLQAEMEGKMEGTNREVGQEEMGFMLTWCWVEGGFIWAFVKTDVITPDPTSTASFPLDFGLCTSILCSIPIFLFTFVSAADYFLIPGDTLFIYSRPTPPSIAPHSCL